MKNMILYVLLLLLVSCGETKKESTETEPITAQEVEEESNSKEGDTSNRYDHLGEYVYFNYTPRCLHTSLRCLNFSVLGSNTSAAHYYAVERKLTKDVSVEDLKYCCSKCVSDTSYKKLLELARH